MYAVNEGKIKINGEMVGTFEREVQGMETALYVTAGSTGYKGCRKREGGGRTFISIECIRGDFFFEPVVEEDGTVTGIGIACCGDDALDAVMKALEFAHTVIDDQRCEVDN